MPKKRQPGKTTQAGERSRSRSTGKDEKRGKSPKQPPTTKMKRLQSGRGRGGGRDHEARPAAADMQDEEKRRDSRIEIKASFAQSLVSSRGHGVQKRSGRECVWVARQGRNLEGPDSFLLSVGRQLNWVPERCREVVFAGRCVCVVFCRGWLVGWFRRVSGPCVCASERSRDQATPPIRDPGWAHSSPAMRGLALGAAGEGTLRRGWLLASVLWHSVLQWPLTLKQCCPAWPRLPLSPSVIGTPRARTNKPQPRDRGQGLDLKRS